jgi:prepilin peptidase CpaA
MTMSTTLANTAFIALAAIAAVSDIRGRRVSNELVLVICFAGLARHALALDAAAVALGVAGTAVGLAMLLPAFAARWVGGGDVKLLAALGAWLGPWGVLVGGLYGIALGGLLAIAMAVAGGAGREVAHNLGTALVTLSSPVAPRRRRALMVPLAVPLALGCAIVLLGGAP